MNIFGLFDRENTVPKNAKPTFNAHGTFIKIDYMLDHVL